MPPAKRRKPLIALAVIGLFLFLSSIFLNLCFASKDKRTSEGLTHYLMGSFYERQDNLDEAIREYKKAIELDPNSAWPHLRMGTAYIRKYEFDKAIVELKQAKRIDDANLEAGLLLALLYASQNEADRASVEYEEVLKKSSVKDPQNVNILKSLGIIYTQRKDLDQAVKVYSLILEINKDDNESLFMLGTIYEEKGKREEAVEKFKQALIINPDYSDALNSLAYIYAEESKNLAEAEKFVKKALEKEPNNPAYLDTLGWIYFKQNLYPEAIKELELASYSLKDPIIFDHLGEAYFKNGDSYKADRAWKKSLELDDKQEDVKEKLKKL